MHQAWVGASFQCRRQIVSTNTYRAALGNCGAIAAMARPSEAVWQFVINGVDNYNIAITGEAVYYPVNFFLKGSRGEL